MRIPTFGQFKAEAKNISRQFDILQRLEAQAQSGLKIQQSSEDPVLGAQIKQNQDYLNVLQSYSTNLPLAQNRATQFTTSMQTVTNTMTDILTQLTKAQSSTLTPANKQAIAVQLQSDLTALLNAANRQDVDGSYVFSGLSNNTSPYVLVNGSYQYQGSFTSTSVNIAQNISTLFNEVGDNVFGNMFNGNGTFTINAGAGNTGGATTDPGSVTNQSAYVPDNYTLSFAQSGTQMTYTVTGTSGIVAGPTAFTPSTSPGVSISFNGINFNLLGTPNVTDTFQIQPSTPQNVFNQLQNVINLLNSTTTTPTSYNQQMSQLNQAFKGIANQLTSYQSQVGIRSAAINNQTKASQSEIVNEQTSLSRLADANPYEVLTTLMQQSIVLQTTQESYMKLQDTLLQLLRNHG